jgi:hypothetical protein
MAAIVHDGEVENKNLYLHQVTQVTYLPQL